MERKRASDFPPEVLQLFDGYVHGLLTRREFLDRAARFAAGGFTAAAMLDALAPNYAWAEQIKNDDARIRAEHLPYSSPKGSGAMRGYFVKPANLSGKTPGVVVIHENRGLTPYIEDVARRVAVAGYAAFAPDALAPLGGYPGDDDTGRALFARQDPAKRMEDLIAAVPFLKSRPECDGAIGAVGFCFGGRVVNQLAVNFPDLRAAAPFYGDQPATEDVPKIKAALLIHHAANDERINAGWPAFEAALKAAGVRYAMHMYPNTQHGFHNDTTPRYDEAAAKLAWQRTLDFFAANLRAA